MQYITYLRHIVFASCIAIPCSLYVMEPLNKRSTSSSSLCLNWLAHHPVPQGITVSALEVALGGQALMLLKIASQNKMNFSWNMLGRGLTTNIMSVMPTTATQTTVYNKLQNNTSYSNELCASIAGAFSTFICTPSELIITQQATKNKNTLKTLQLIYKHFGVSAFYRGTILTALREGGFTFGYLSLPEHLTKYTLMINSHDTLAALESKIAAGIIVGFITHPIDVLKTLLQSDLEKKSFINAFQAFKAVLKKDGMKGLLRGANWRIARVCTATVIFSMCFSYFDALKKENTH